MAQLKDMNVDGDLVINESLINNNIDILTRIDNDLTKFENAFCTVQELPYTITAGSGYTINESSVLLFGNRLRIYVYATRSSNFYVGNLTNETVATLHINHGGKILSGYNGSSITYATGPTSTYFTTYPDTGDTWFDIDVQISATSGTTNIARTMILLTVQPNIDAY